ncbi:conserved hypothetical protein (plasmid) [Acidithiobacillus caldus SM-1]|uniref:LysM domain-containing protein n=1 Tax=Acidithiobacillus caldus (strain SM-1) TaxID=990288 RepID=F9ZUT4_ACICS|nr:LysM domain-containing protein [Acidithiobacillus caldus]AEK59648.1 conserved hypothetical protein [Acidithiobacillus caldus SM-1]
MRANPRAATAVLVLSGVLLAGCAQMPERTANSTLAQQNLREASQLLRKQHELDLATDAVANKLDRVQHIINRRIRDHQPLIHRDKMTHSVNVILPDTPCQTQVVHPGDTLSSLAAKYQVTVADLMRWNGITNPNLVRIGQKLQVTACHKKG